MAATLPLDDAMFEVLAGSGREADWAPLRSIIVDWAEETTQTLRQAGLDVENGVFLPDADGGVSVHFHRSAVERTALENFERDRGLAGSGRARLGLILRTDMVVVGLELPETAEGDRAYVDGWLKGDANALETLSAQMASLPDEFVLVGDDPTPCTRVSTDVLRATLADWIAGSSAWALAWQLSREDALSHCDILGEQLKDAMVMLAGLFKRMTWSRQSNPRSSTHHQSPASRTWQKSRSPIVESLMKGAQRPRAMLSHRGFGPADSGPEPEKARYGGFEQGQRVRATEGAFRGRVGVIMDFDGRGAARVLFGLLSTKVGVKQLEVLTDERERKTLQSSHTRLGEGGARRPR